MIYRLEFDGFRGVAIIMVLLYHLGFNFSKYGFLGVDIFLVLSGYLITSRLLSFAFDGGESFSLFLQRRFVRLFPLQAVVIITSLVFSLAILNPLELQDFATTSVYAISFLSNIHFWKIHDYFSQLSNQLPLLHTWSLSLEFQFYILVSVIYFALRSQDKRFFSFLIIIITLFSFGGFIHFYESSPVAAFYLLPFRLWEFGVGCVLAIYTSKQNINSIIFIFIGFILFILDHFFGVLAGRLHIVSVFLVSLLIIKFESLPQCVRRVFTNRIIVFLGNISC